MRVAIIAYHGKLESVVIVRWQLMMSFYLFTQGVTVKKSFIVTQIPTSNTSIDFWTMCVDYSCSLVVCLDDSSADVCTVRVGTIAGLISFAKRCINVRLKYRQDVSKT